MVTIRGLNKDYEQRNLIQVMVSITITIQLCVSIITFKQDKGDSNSVKTWNHKVLLILKEFYLDLTTFDYNQPHLK